MKRTYSLITITLFLSLFVYLFYRTEKTVVNELIMLFFSLDVFGEIRNSIAQSIPLAAPLIFSLPGGLWVFCTTVLSKGLFVKLSGYEMEVTGMPLVFAVGLEFCQLTGLTNGTFDPWDIGFSVMFWLVAYYGFRFSGTRQNILSNFTHNGYIWLACFASVYLAHVSQ